MQWNDFIKTHGPKSGAFLQTLEWGQFQTMIGRQVFYFASIDGKIKLLEETEVRQAQNIDGAALAILMPISFGKKFLYIPRGPVGRGTESIIDLAKKVAQKENAIFLKIELPKAETWKLKAKSSFSLQPEQTVILNLNKKPEELLSTMHPKTRYNIALARKHNVHIEHWNNSEIAASSRQSGTPRNDVFNQWFDLIKTTAKRDGFHLHPKEYYQQLLSVNGELKTELWLAWHDNDLLAGNLTAYFNKTATYLHGASSNSKRNLMAPYLLHWEIILDAQTKDYTAYDFWGIDEKKWPGLTRFKRGFGNAQTLEEITASPASDFPLNKFWYWLYSIRKILKR